MVDAEVSVLDPGVAEAVPEREQRGAFLVPVPPRLVLGLMGPGVGVDHRQLPDGPRPRERQLAAGRDVAEQQVRDRSAALRAGVPDVEDGRHVLGRPAQVEGSPVHDEQDDGRAGGRNGLEQLELAAGELQRRARRGFADHVLPFAGHDDGDVGLACEVDRAGELGLVVEALGVLGRVAGEHVEHRREEPLPGTHAGRVLHPCGVADLAPDAVQHGDRLVEVEVEAPRAERVALGVRERAEHGDRVQGGRVERQHVALVAQQDRRALGRDPGDVAVRGVGEHLASAVLVDVRIVEQPQAQLRLQHPAHARVQRLLAHRAALDRLGQAAEGRVAHRHLHVHSRVQGPGARIGQVRGEAVRREVADRVGVADGEALEAERIPQHVGEQPPVAGRGNPVEGHVGRHDVAGAGRDSRREGRQVDVPQLGIGEVDLVVVAATERGAVAGEVLGTGDDALGRAHRVPLEATHLGGCDGGAEERILARAFDDPAPPRITGDVDHRREGPGDADRPCLTRRDRLTLRDRLGIPRRRHRDRHRQDRAQPMDHVVAEQDRDAEPAAFDREPLQAVDLRRVGDEQQRPDLALPHRGLDGLRRRPDTRDERHVVRAAHEPEVEVLRQLPGLLGRCHPGDQLIDPRPDLRLRHRSSAISFPSGRRPCHLTW